VVGPAAFLALLWPRLREGRTERTVALAGALIALAATPFCPPGLPIVLAAAAALGAAMLPSAGPLPPGGEAALPTAGGAALSAPGEAALSAAEGAAPGGRPDPAGAAGAAGDRPCR
jgi:hypothetical protein